MNPTDYYWIHPQIGQRIILDLTGIPSGANYDLALVLEQGTKIFNAVVESKEPGVDNEHIEYQVTTNQIHYIRVRAKIKSTSDPNTYFLTVTVTGPSGTATYRALQINGR